MANLNAEIGFVLEGDRAGHFYTRTGHWVVYQTAAQAYVWSEEQVVAIRESARSASTGWVVKPKTVYPAVYEDRTGVTVITGHAEPVDSLKASFDAKIVIPQSNGSIFDMNSVTTRLSTNEVLASAMSL